MLIRQIVDFLIGVYSQWLYDKEISLLSPKLFNQCVFLFVRIIRLTIFLLIAKLQVSS